MLRRTALGVLSLVPLAALGACKKGPKRVRIAVVPKGTTHEFWKAVHAGASAAASELDVDVGALLTQFLPEPKPESEEDSPPYQVS